MKRTTVYILALVMMLTLLSACGTANKPDASPSTSLTPSASPTAAVTDIVPAPGDGDVNDTDGIITDGDTGAVGENGTGADNSVTDGIATGDNALDTPTATPSVSPSAKMR